MKSKWVISIVSTDHNLNDERTKIQEFLKYYEEKITITSGSPVFSKEPTKDRVDIVVVIINKRYNGLYVNNKMITITEAEFKEACRNDSIAIIPCVHEEALNEYIENNKRNHNDENVKVMNFIRIICEEGKNEYFMPYVSSDDLIGRLEEKLKDLSMFIGSLAVGKQKSAILKTETFVATSKSVGDVISDELYMDPSYEYKSGDPHPQETPLDNAISDGIAEGSKILLTGDGGVGKSMLLMKSYLTYILDSHDT